MRHIIPVSGGKDSAAMCVLMHKKLPEAEYVFCDTGAELKETYEYLDRLEKKLNIKIVRLGSDKGFDHWLNYHHGFLPSPRARWCTIVMKIKPFEKYCGDDDITSYIGIRADEAKRIGYFNPKKPKIKAKYPFIEQGIKLDDVYNMLDESGVGLPTYYKWRSRSGCYFCFFQRRVEWVKLSEEHPDLFEKALAYEDNSGYKDSGKKMTWVKGMTLRDIIAKKDAIKARFDRKVERARAKNKQMSLEALEEKVLDEESSDKCGVCHI